MAEKIFMTALSPTMEEGLILSWNKKEGDEIKSGDVICEVETDKASMEYESSQVGELLKILHGVGDTVRVGDTIAIVGKKGEDYTALLTSTQSAPSKDEEKGKESQVNSSIKTTSLQMTPHSSPHSSGRIKISPLARKIAGQKNIDIENITGSGPGGRIVKKDLEVALVSVDSASLFKQSRSDTIIPVAGTRAVIARRLSESKYSSPHYYLRLSINMTGVIGARNSLNKGRSEKVSMNAFFLKYTSEALKRHPMVNASWQGDSIRQFASIDIGLAVDLGAGLFTPVVRDCGSKGIVAIDAELKTLITKVRDKKISPEEYSNASFTISNLGSFGVEDFTAIINPPGAAILAVGQTLNTVVAHADKSMSVEPMMKVNLSCDHRVIDGIEGARFIADMKAIMEEPFRMLF